MTKSVFQRLGYTSHITLTTNDSVLSVPGKSNNAFVSKSCYEQLSVTTL